jgi:hypothetical protein
MKSKPVTSPAPGSAICYCTHPKQPHRAPLYVSQLPGEMGKDWGYTTKPEGVLRYDAQIDAMRALDAAKPLSVYWQRRFRRDCERVGMTFHALPVTG